MRIEAAAAAFAARPDYYAEQADDATRRAWTRQGGIAATEKERLRRLHWLTPIVLAIGSVLFLDVDAAAAAPVAEESSLYISLRDIYNETKQRNNSQRQCWD